MLFNIKKGENILDTLIKNQIPISSSCGGKRKCGKCKVELLSGSLELDALEKTLLSKYDLDNNIRLACFHNNIKEDITVSVDNNDENIQVLGANKLIYEITKPEEGIGVAIDIGTTTVVIAYIDLCSGKVIFENRMKNPQSIFGADVLTRILYSKENNCTVLHDQIRNAINSSIQSFIDKNEITKMYVTGNPTMLHFFLNEDPITISEFPYSCKVEDVVRLNGKNYFDLDFEITVLPNISAFVGGDIVSGVISTNLYTENKVLLIDLGTNGEMAFSYNDEIYTTSTAAGPAFEGGNMSFGVASISGAINFIRLDNNNVEYTTIDNKTPIGICGSGYISGITELLKNNNIDETGYMDEQFKITDNISLTQADIRNFQLAKSAIRTGIDILVKNTCVDFNNIDKVYISGGFSSLLKIDDLIYLKILPEQLKDKTTLYGNSALDGTIKVMLNQNINLDEIKKKSHNINLAEDKYFTDIFTDNMWF